MKPTPLTPPADVVEGNKLIAEFMGAMFNAEYPTIIYYNSPTTNTPVGYIDQLLFHSSWDWLMPVVEKIEDLGYVVKIFTEQFSYGRRHRCWIINKTEHGDNINDWGYNGDKSKINAVYTTVTQFLQWHNNQKLKP